MKKRSFFSLFLIFALVVSLLTPTASASSSAILDDMEIDAQAALLVDMDTDVVLYSNNADEAICPASLTKVMTALLVFEHIEAGDLSLDDKITAYDDCWFDLDSTSSNQNIQPGEVMTVEDLLYCMLVASANEAANILAETVSGSTDSFVEEMNARAKALGCTSTNFVNTHGMPDDDHYSSCSDLYLIAKAAMGYSTFREIVSTTEYYVDATNLSERRHFFNTNGLLSNLRYSGYVYSSCIGIKTGTTDEGGYNLLAAAEQSDKTLISVVIGCEPTTASDGTVNYTHFSESSRLLQWGFDNFSTITIVDKKDTYGSVPVTLSTDADSVSVAPEESIEAELPNDITADSFTVVPTLRSSVEAPVEAGDVLGTLVLYLDGEEYAAVNLIAVNDVEASVFLKRKAMVMDLLSRWYIKALLVLVAVAILALILRLTLFRKARRNRYGSYSGGRRGGRSGGGYRGSRRRRR
ncbi:MAG: D-alanyl-D-alanine carboxypeptidase [Clostridiales bacterium]|nr:D-alanyl-D-alanine carboxypeptidase [Clostridiales bacterium]